MSEPMHTVTARPLRTARLAWACAAFVFVVFAFVALVMKRDNAGAHFGDEDQVFTVVIGLILAGACLMPTRPRLVADEHSVRLRGYLGSFRTVPWELIERVEFPSNARFARLVLPAEEILAIYAVQRTDREDAVVSMRALRDLFAASRLT